MIGDASGSSPQISVGMPVYNSEKYLATALDSILSQSFRNFELILSDNASTDKTQNICQEYAARDARIKYIRQNSNVGVIENFSFVLTHSSANYFMWAAADDIRSPNWLQNSYTRIQNDPQVALVFASTLAIDENGKELKCYSFQTELNLSGSRFLRRLKFWFMYEGLGKANIIYGLYDKKLSGISTVRDNWTCGKIKHDLTFIYSILNNGALASVQNCSLFKRVHKASEEQHFAKNRSLLKKIFWPFPNELFRDYLRNSSFAEKALLTLLFPFKFISGSLTRVKLLLKRSAF